VRDEDVPSSKLPSMSADEGTNDKRSHRERMLAGDPYLADDAQLVHDSRRARRLMDQLNLGAAGDTQQRRRILDELLGAFGKDAEIRPPLYCDYGYQIRVGARTFINVGLVALDVAAIIIGEDVQIGPNAQLLTPTHPVEAEPRRAKWEAAKPISIGDNVWLGGGVIVLAGVTIGSNTVVGAGAVVTKSLPANILAVGNPARVIRSL
jgi:maltose O-acetyltransferase